MAWYAWPSRREISILLFSLTVFVLFYNLETSLEQWRAVQRLAAEGHSRGRLTAGLKHDINWEKELYGDWTWEEEQVAGRAKEKKAETQKNSSSLWVSDNRTLAIQHPEIYGTIGMSDGYIKWGEEIPTTRVVKHVPGSTVLDHVYLLNGTIYVLTDDLSFPPLGSIASSTENPSEVPRPSDWRLITTKQGREIFGTYSGLIHGVTWLCTDAHPSNYTLFSLWRTYSSLDPSISPSAPPPLPPPRRIFYPNIPTLVGLKPDSAAPILPRQRSPSGFHPYLPKAAFPMLGLMFREDWEDFATMQAPFLLSRVVVFDEGSALRSRGDVPPFALPLLQLDASEHWWEPIRRNVAAFLGVSHEAEKSWMGSQKVVTYLPRQDAEDGPKLKRSDHEALMVELRKLEDSHIVNVIPANAPWAERMAAILQSTIVIGVYGDHLADSVFMVPSARSALMEIFPPGTFVRDAEVSMKSLGISYFAWWNDQLYSGKSLPPVIPPTESTSTELPINVPSLLRAIRKI